MALVILYFLFICFGLLFTSIFNLEFEYSVPIITSFISIISFIFGFFGFLEYSLYFIIGICILSLFLAVYYSYKKKNKKEFIKKCFNESFIIFSILYIVLILMNKDMLCYSWDELSHWGDVVKAMTQLDKLSVESIMNSGYSNYPPAMSLFQYFVQKINILINGEYIFTEWYMYFSYQLFYISFAFPILSKIKNKVLFIVSIFITPFIFSTRFLFRTLNIDGFISILTGFGLISNIFLIKNKKYHILYLSLLCFVLSISKEVGVFFSTFVIFAYIISNIKSNNLERNELVFILILMISAYLPKILWSYLVKINEANIVFSNVINIKDLINLILNKDCTYKQSVYNNYFIQLFKPNPEYIVPLLRIELPVAVIVILLILLIIILIYFNKSNVYVITVGCTSILLSLLYIYGLSIVYAFKFYEYEALNYASLDRYICIIVSLLFFVFIGILFYCIDKIKNKKVIYTFIVMSILFTVIFGKFYYFFDKTYVNISKKMRNMYTNIENKVLLNIPENSKVFIISQEDDGYNYWMLHYISRPIKICKDDLSWSFGTPFYENDLYTMNIKPYELINKLIENDYDYVVIFRTNDYFNSNYSSIFSNPAYIDNETIFSIDKESKLLNFVK